MYTIREFWTIGYLDHLYLFTVVVIFDGFSQICGQLFGRHKMVPRISPGKTWEGFLGGIAITAAIMVLYLRDVHAILLILLLAIGALAGDLLASYFKRICGVKDYGNWIPGHGGLLDRFDGFLGAAAAYMIYFYVSTMI
jgi:phosphatidate cytidylyltransferase